VTLTILTGKIKRANSDKWKPLKLGEVVNDGDLVQDQTRYGLRVIRCIATMKHEGKRRVKTYTLKTNAPNASGEDIRKAFEAQAERWKVRVISGEVKVDKLEQEEIEI